MNEMTFLLRTKFVALLIVTITLLLIIAYANAAYQISLPIAAVDFIHRITCCGRIVSSTSLL